MTHVCQRLFRALLPLVEGGSHQLHREAEVCDTAAQPGPHQDVTCVEVAVGDRRLHLTCNNNNDNVNNPASERNEVWAYFVGDR